MIELQNVSKTYNYKKSNAFQALTNVSLKIEDGEMVAIVGKSGAGKSTLLHIIGCIDNFETGSYKLDGKEVAGMTEGQKAVMRNQKVGIVLQDFALIEDETAQENVLIPVYFRKKKPKEKKLLAYDALKKVEMQEYLSKPVKKMSGGQKQRIAIARALINEPSVLLADEPTGALDSVTADEIMKVFEDLNKEGKTVVIITHDREIAQRCSRIIEIKDGKLV